MPGGHVLGWAAVVLCATYSVFAFSMAAVAVLSLAGVIPDAPSRTAPPLFVAHAVAGGVALVCGAAQLQLARRWLRSRPRAHRVLGRVYAVASWAASAASLGVALLFDVPVAARMAFAAGAVLWFSATTVAVVRIRRGRIAEHRQWMVRSFSVSFFFVTASLWMPVLAATSIPASVGYPLAIVLGWGANLAAAEVWLRRARPSAAGPLSTPAASSARA
jgi:uncharacterized membrane protein